MSSTLTTIAAAGDDDADHRIKALEDKLAQLAARLANVESPLWGKVLMVDNSASNRTWFEVGANGTNLVGMTGARVVSSTATAGLLLLPLPTNTAAVMQFQTGTMTAYFELTPPPLATLIVNADQSKDLAVGVYYADFAKHPIDLTGSAPTTNADYIGQLPAAVTGSNKACFFINLDEVYDGSGIGGHALQSPNADNTAAVLGALVGSWPDTNRASALFPVYVGHGTSGNQTDDRETV